MGRPAKYPDQFRKDALALVESSGRPIAEVARSLGVAEGTLWNWVRATREATGLSPIAWCTRLSVATVISSTWSRLRFSFDSCPCIS